MLGVFAGVIKTIIRSHYSCNKLQPSYVNGALTGSGTPTMGLLVRTTVAWLTCVRQKTSP